MINPFVKPVVPDSYFLSHNFTLYFNNGSQAEFVDSTMNMFCQGGKVNKSLFALKYKRRLVQRRNEVGLEGILKKEGGIAVYTCLSAPNWDGFRGRQIEGQNHEIE